MTQFERLRTSCKRDAASLDDFARSIIGALHDAQSGAGRVDNGVALLETLREPVTTMYGTSTHVYKYRDGCRPATELNRGVQAVFFTAKSPSGDELTFSVGKAAEAGEDMYRFRGDRTTGPERELVVEQIVSEAEITAPLMLSGASRLSDVLPSALQIGTHLELDSYNVQAIHGLIDHDRGRI